MHKIKQVTHFGADVHFGEGAQVFNREGVGAAAGTGVVATEYGVGFIHKTVLTLTNTPIPQVSITTGNGIGGVKVYDMPVGTIKIIGAAALIDLSIAAGKQADFTDATPSGDLGLGSAAIVDPTAFSTDATDDNICAGVATDMADYADADVSLVPYSGDVNFASPLDVYLNALTDAADIDNGVTTELLANGLIVLYWINLTAGL